MRTEIGLIGRKARGSRCPQLLGYRKPRSDKQRSRTEPGRIGADLAKCSSCFRSVSGWMAAHRSCAIARSAGGAVAASATTAMAMVMAASASSASSLIIVVVLLLAGRLQLGGPRRVLFAREVPPAG